MAESAVGLAPRPSAPCPLRTPPTPPGTRTGADARLRHPARPGTRGALSVARAMLYEMARKTANDDPLAPVTLAVGQEDLLLDRAVREVVAAARASDADTDVRDLTSDQLQPGTLAELTSPSLFAERKVVVVRNAQDLSADTVKDVKAYLGAPAEEITLVLLHAAWGQGQRAARCRAQGRGAGGGLPEDDEAGGPAGVRAG